MNMAPWHRPHPQAQARARPKRCDPFYKTARWLHFRAWILERFPLCADPFLYHAEDGQTVSATDVHHIQPRRKRPDLELELENMQALCKSCHSRISKHG